MSKHKIQLVECNKATHTEYEVRIDGKTVYSSKNELDASGKFLIWFNDGYSPERIIDEREVKILDTTTE